MFSSDLLFEGRPDRSWSSSDMSPHLNQENHSQNPCLAQSFLFKSLSKHCDSFCCCFPRRKQNLMQTRSFKSAIEKSTKTMTEAQEKNHTDHIDLSSRMPRGQLMRRAVTYTHQAGAGGTNALLSSRKKFSLFLGPPHILNTEYYLKYVHKHV